MEVYSICSNPTIDIVVRPRRLQWLGGFRKDGERRKVRRVAVWIHESKRKRVRPRKRWRDAVMADMNKARDMKN